MPCLHFLFQLREDVASCQPLATALDNGRVILCDRIADPWVRIQSLSPHGGPAVRRGPPQCSIPPPSRTNLGQPGPTAALTPPHHQDQPPQGSPNPSTAWGLPLPAQLHGNPHALSLQNAFWFSLGCCTFFLIPNIIFAVRLTKHFRPIRNRLM